MSTAQAIAPAHAASRDDAFHRRMHQNHMYGMWELPLELTPAPAPRMQPWLWRWPVTEQAVRQSAVAVPVGDERRAIQLFNPGLDGAWATTNTMVAAVQVLLPGETARAHRHSLTALRFVMQGSGAYTTVEGERCVMHPGDLILTPNWTWHDHGNETGETAVWLDCLDLPLTKALNAIFFDVHPERQPPLTKAVNASQQLYGHGRLSPTWTSISTPFSPLMIYSWEQTAEALHAMRDHEGSPYEGIALEYTNPQTGGPALPTIGCRIQLLRRGERLKARRVTGTSILYVVQGSGHTVVDGRQFAWEKGDILALPSWALHEHAAAGGEDAIVFSMSDLPVMRSLGLYREEPLAQNGGHQEITSRFQ